MKFAAELKLVRRVAAHLTRKGTIMHATYNRPRAESVRVSLCTQCNALDRELARKDPHAALLMASSLELASGIREGFKCQICGTAMQRFRAKQTVPAPSDRWRIV